MQETLDDRIRTLECLAFNAWPALQTLVYDGWLMRFSYGHTKRANSVNALWPCRLPLEARIAHAEALYRQHHILPTFRLTPLAEPELGPALAARGYVEIDASIVLEAPIGRLAALAGSDAELAERADGEWLAGFARATDIGPATRGVLGEMLRAAVPPASFARVRDGAGTDLAFGMGVAEGDALGIFEMLTLPAARRQGHAARIIGSLARWAAARGARRAYLQVVASNAAARALYAKLGFSEAYAYSYRRLTA
ncbi:MAG: GNAT family N-acetyltransferase [Alphaproteobacteria bacterium]|nr:GNAT family N-acetyltransferase [Alphaproteobacteria bacterium]